MRRRTARALAVATATAAVAFAASGPGRAASAASLNNMYPTLSGVPAELPVGGTIDLTLNLDWVSAYPIDITGLAISMGSSAGGTSTQGISVLWQDPATGAWRSSDKTDGSSGRWGMVEPQGAVTIDAGGNLSVHLKITMSSAARTGTEHIDAGSFDYFAPDGNLPPGHVTAHTVQAAFEFGGTSYSSQPTPTATPVPEAPATTSAAGVAPTSAGSAQPSRAVLPDTLVGNPMSPGGPRGTTSSPSPVPPSRTAPPDTITAANTVFRGAKALSVLGAVAVLLSFLVGSGLVIVRSRRFEPPQSAAPPSTDDEA